MAEGPIIKAIKPENLRVGMYVKLGKYAQMLPLFEESFKVASETQIVNIIDKGVPIVNIDLDKSDLDGIEFDDVEFEENIPTDEEFNPIKMISDDLRHVIENPNAPPETKAKAVYSHSLKMMETILETPSPENILSGKQMIHNIVDHILADDETAGCLTQITSHDYYTYTHSVNVGLLSILLSKSVFTDTSDHDMKELGAAFFLYDLGKCNVPAHLINKPGELNEKEWEMMKKHPTDGYRILAEAKQLSDECAIIVMQHHERYNGDGYPKRLRDDQIHVYARICSITDVYDALTSTRSYKKKIPTFEALHVMKDEMIGHFYRDLFEKFVLLFK